MKQHKLHKVIESIVICICNPFFFHLRLLKGVSYEKNKGNPREPSLLKRNLAPERIKLDFEDSKQWQENSVEGNDS